MFHHTAYDDGWQESATRNDPIWVALFPAAYEQLEASGFVDVARYLVPEHCTDERFVCALPFIVLHDLIESKVWFSFVPPPQPSVVPPRTPPAV